MNKCLDCGLPYRSFPIDTTLPDEQWLMIHPEGKGGLLCANCMVRRASKLDGIIAARMKFEFASSAHKSDESPCSATVFSRSDVPVSENE